MRKISTILNVALLAAIAFAGYYLIKSHVEADIYREKFEKVSADYEKMRTTYNEAVKKTAVTELLVNEDGSVCVVFVTLDGQEKILPTQFKMGNELFVDYVTIDDRTYFRRVFDQKTTPENALYIDPKLQEVEWKSAGEEPNALPHPNHSQVTDGVISYVKLSNPGRWEVTITGDGKPDIRKKDKNEPPSALVPSVQVRDYSQIEKEVKDQIEGISFSDVMSRLFGGGDGE